MKTTSRSKILLSIILVLTLLWETSVCILASGPETIVHITNTGDKYHRAGCQSLWNSDIPVTLEYAVSEGKTPCSKCNPPVLDGKYTVEDVEQMLQQAEDSSPTPNTYKQYGTYLVYIKSGTFHLPGCPEAESDGIIRALSYTSKEFVPCEYCKPLQYSTLDESLKTQGIVDKDSQKQSSPVKKPGKKIPIVIDIIAYIFIALLALCFLSSFLFFILEPIHDIISRIKKNKNSRKQKQLLEDKAQNDYEYYFSCYAFYSPESFVKIPKGTYIKDGLPCSNGPGRYGIYTVYITPKGTHYHRRELCLRSSNLKETNLVYAKIAHSPCARCTKKEPDLSWYWEYKRIRDIKEKYNIP